MATSRRLPGRRPSAGGRGTAAPRDGRTGSRSGSARSTTARATPKRAVGPADPPATDPPPGDGGRPSGRIALVGLILLVLVISYASSLRAWLQQRDDLEDARAELTSTQAQIDDLEQSRLRWQDPAFIEQQARLRLGWVLPGEVGYRVIGSDGEPLGETVLEPDELVEPAPEDWYDALWGSVEAAGEDPEAQEAEPEQVGPDPDEVLGPVRQRSGPGR